LVTKADGSKFGKSESGNVWLDPARTSPYAFFQFWLRTADTEIGSYLRRFTFLARPRIAELDEATATHPERRQAQRALAFEVTALVHGADEARRAEAAAAVLFTAEIASLDADTLESALADAPTSMVSRSELDGALSVLEALVRSGLATSRANARQLLAQGSVYVNGKKVAEDRPLQAGDALHGRWVVLRRGRSSQHVLAVKD
jgi:tyrosyl-tRNA synthetase